jgi:hypothetical protein
LKATPLSFAGTLPQERSLRLMFSASGGTDDHGLGKK